VASRDCSLGKQSFFLHRAAQLVAEAKAIFHLAAAVGVELVVNSPIRTIETYLRETEADSGRSERSPCAGAAGLHVRSLWARARRRRSRDGRSADRPTDAGPVSYACSKLMDEFLALATRRSASCPW